MKVVIYPNIYCEANSIANPYIADFISSLKTKHIEVSNPPHKNPLFSLVFKKIDNDIYIFHWIENVPDYKYGYLQALLAIFFVWNIKWHNKKIIWFLHNKEPHGEKHSFLKKYIMNRMFHASDYIITHAKEGVTLLNNYNQKLKNKVLFFNHPTKNRLSWLDKNAKSSTFDILIWGTISRYKRVLEFLQYAKNNKLELRIKVIGKCNDEKLCNELLEQKTKFVDIELKGVSFEELASYIQDSKFVLIPYAAKTVLSSGILMDSLSMGAKVIGPDVGSFKDYSSNSGIEVFTFESFEDIEGIVRTNTVPININEYNSFLNDNSWINFVDKIVDRIE